MRTTPEQRAALRRAYVIVGNAGAREVAVLDDFDEALSELAALRAVAEAAREHVLRVDGRAALVKLAPQICLDEAGWTSETLRQALDAVSEQYAAEDALRDALRAWEERR